MALKKLTLKELKDKIIFWQPEHILCQDKNYMLIAQMDLFNNHIEFYTYDLNNHYEEGHSFNVSEAVEYFYNKINQKECKMNNRFLHDKIENCKECFYNYICKEKNIEINRKTS